MQHCTACNKAYATVHILDLREGSVVEHKHLCAACAENTGVVAQKVQPLTFHQAEMLDLIGSIALGEGGKRIENVTCPACNLTAAEFKVRGRMGCPRCYEVFKPSLLALLERVHDATSHRGRVPGRSTPATPSRGDVLTDLRRRLQAAIGAENYEEAASLRDRIREFEGAEEGSA